MNQANRTCPVCGKAEVEFLHSQRFELPDGYPLSQGYDVVNCLSCGFVYADTSVSQADYDRFYTELSKYEDQKTSTGGGEDTFDLARLEITAHQITDFLHDPSARIIDVGCANGGLLKELKNLGYEYLCGLDPSPVCVENTIALGFEAYAGSLFNHFLQGKYDCIVLSHILEHIQDLHGAIKRITEILAPDGKQVIYIEVPDASHYVDFLLTPFQEFNTEHINHFSQTSLNNLMRFAGFEELKSGKKIFATGLNMDYPAIYGFWKKSNTKSIFEFLPDTQLEFHIKEYIRRSKTILEAIEARLQKILQQNPKVIVWGTGQLAMKLLVETSLRKANIVAFVDNNPVNQGQTLRGLKILPPNALIDLNYPILITTILHQQEIATQIQQMAIPNDVVFLQ